MTLFSDRDERVIENLRIINSRFARKPRKVPVRAVRPSPFTSATGAFTEVIIAASDTRDDLKAMAHYVCAGTNDEATWRQMLVDLEMSPSFPTGGKGRVKVLDGNYVFQDRLTFNEAGGFGKLQFIGEGFPTIRMDYNTVSPTDGFAPLIAIHGSSYSTQTPLSFSNILFDGNNQSNGICLFQSTNSVYPLMNVEQCIFINWDRNIWWSEGAAAGHFHHNKVLNCTFPASNGAFWINGGGPNGPVFVTDNIFENCTGNMAWGNAHTYPTLFDRNIQWTGTMTLNTFAGIELGTNYGF